LRGQLAGFSADDRPLVIHPACGSRRGHPLLVTRGCFEAVLGWDGDGGLRAALGGCLHIDVPLDDPGILLDADTPADFERLLEAFDDQTK
jgi:CTP:molybdopterin cytidylyltransferase MocA